MMKDVVISIRAIQACGMDDEDLVEFTTDGLYTFDGEVGCLTYMETEVTGLEGTRTSVMVMPDQVVVDRDGLITSRMIFKEGARDSFLYNTPYGNLEVGISTSRLYSTISPEGGKLEIDYSIEIDHALAGRNSFRISVREAQSPLKQ